MNRLLIGLIKSEFFLFYFIKIVQYVGRCASLLSVASYLSDKHEGGVDLSPN